jgi:hypothetical protein
LSASDQGVLIPHSLYQTIYKPKICIRPFSIFSIDEYEYIIFFGHQSSLELFNGKLNRDGHRFLHYMFQLYENLPDSILSSITLSVLLFKVLEINFFDKLALNVFHSPVKNNFENCETD